MHTVLIAVLSIFTVTSLTSKSHAAENERPLKIIYDTDIGSDIDDAFAHALIQASPEFEVLGITVADGHTERRAPVSCRLLYICGQDDIPVAVGKATRTDSPVPPQLIWGEGFDEVKPIRTSAEDFIIDMLNKYPNEVVIISVGPVTNLADVIEKDPEAWKKVKHVYSMFGSFYMGYGGGVTPDPEWNVRADVRSSQIFMNSGVDITLAGLDVTSTVKFDAERRQAISMRNSPMTDALCGLYSLWSHGNMDRSPTLYDPVAVAMAITDDFTTKRRAHVRVTDEGYTVVDESKQPNCYIGMEINEQKFLDWFTWRVLHQNLTR